MRTKTPKNVTLGRKKNKDARQPQMKPNNRSKASVESVSWERPGYIAQNCRRIGRARASRVRRAWERPGYVAQNCRRSADLLSKVEGTSRCGNVLSEVWQFRQSCQGIWFDSETSELQNIKGREGGREWRAMCRTIRLGLQQLCAILCGQNWFEALRLCAFLRLSRRSRLFSRLYFNIVTPTMTIARCGACCHGRGLCGLLVGSGARRVFHVKDFASGCF